MLASDVSLTQKLLNLIDGYTKKSKKDIQKDLKTIVKNYIETGDFLEPENLINMFCDLDLQLKRNAVRSDLSSIRDIVYGEKKGLFGDMHKIIEDMQKSIIQFLVENDKVDAIKSLNNYLKNPSDFYSKVMKIKMKKFEFQVDKISPNQPIEAYYDYLAGRRWRILLPVMNESTNPEITKIADESAAYTLKKHYSDSKNSFFRGPPGFSRRKQGLLNLMKKIADAYMADISVDVAELTQDLNKRINQFNCDLVNHNSKTSRKFAGLDTISYFDLSNYSATQYDELQQLLDSIENNSKPELVIVLGNKIRNARDRLVKEIRNGYLPRHPIHRECIDKINDLINQYNNKIKSFDYQETKSVKALLFKTESISFIKHQLDPDQLILGLTQNAVFKNQF